MTVELPYSLHSRYASIAIAWTVILIPPIFLNLGLFYGLWYGKPHLDRLLVLTLPTAVLGIFTAIATIARLQKLLQSSPSHRPLNSPRHALDVFQWGYFLVLATITALISSTLARANTDHDNHDLQIRLLSLPPALLMYVVATLTLLSLALHRTGWELPFRFGSVGPGHVLRPAVYYIVEDVVAVDGGGGVAYREAFCARYDSSPVFRRMVFELSVVWMVCFYVLAVVFTVLVFVLPTAAVYAVGWAGPFPLVGGMAVWTTVYVKARLREERGNLREDERRPLLGGEVVQ